VTPDDEIDPERSASNAIGSGPRLARPAQPGVADAFERIQPILAVVIMVTTFLLLPQPFAVALIGLVWLGTTRISRGRRFLGLTLTEALAWAATLVIAFLCLALALYSLGGGTSQ
jgi:hypothetical protein